MGDMYIGDDCLPEMKFPVLIQDSLPPLKLFIEKGSELARRRSRDGPKETQ